MIDLFLEGGLLFMSLLTLLFIGVIYTAVKGEKSLKLFGLLALTIGILGQLIGIFQMYEGIVSMGGEISQAMLVGGLRVSSITTIYGLLIYSISLIIRLVFSLRN
jgi:biopolymer transport protein ExbB/TolQ